MVGALFSVSLPHIYFAQEIRFYALVTLLVALSCYAFVRAMHYGETRWWALNIAVNAVLPWTHVYGPLVWIAQAFALLLFQFRERKLIVVWALAHFAICVAFAIWMFGIVRYVIEDEYVRQATPGYRELLNAFNVYSGGRFGKLNPVLYLPTGVSLDRFLTIALGLFTLTCLLWGGLWRHSWCFFLCRKYGSRCLCFVTRSTRRWRGTSLLERRGLRCSTGRHVRF